MDRIIVINDRRRVVAVSAEYAAMLEYAPHELVGMRTADLVADPRVYELLEAEVIETGQLDTTVDALTKTGRIVPFRFRERTTYVDNGETLFVASGSPVADVMTINEVARTALVSRRTVERWITRGELAALGTVGARRIARSEFEAFLRRHAH